MCVSRSEPAAVVPHRVKNARCLLPLALSQAASSPGFPSRACLPSQNALAASYRRSGRCRGGPGRGSLPIGPLELDAEKRPDTGQRRPASGLDAVGNQTHQRMMIMVKPQVETKSSADVIELVDAARGGDTSAWAELVRRYEPLIASISRRYRISASDAVDVSQTVWLKVVSNLAHLRDPRGLPGWIATTTGRVCMQLIATQRRAVAVDPVVLANPTRPRWRASPAIRAVERKLTRRCSFRNARGRFATAWQSSRRRSADSFACSWSIRRCPTSRSAVSWGCRSGASDRPGRAACISCAVLRRSAGSPPQSH